MIGVGNRWAHDDGAGPAVAATAAASLPDGVVTMELDGEPARLVDAWGGAALAVVVDAVRSGRVPGTIHRLEPGADSLPAWAGARGSHALGLGEAFRLGEALGRLPERLVVLGVEGGNFGPGEGLSESVAEAVAALAAELVRIVTDHLTEVNA